MANKAVVTIDVDDKQFSAFLGLFKQFEGKLGEMPESWRKIGDESTAASEAMAAGMGALLEHMTQASQHAKSLADHLKNASEAQDQFNTSTRQGESGLKKMAKEAKELGDNIFGIGKFLLKVGAIGIGSTIGGLFGIDKLGESAVANQRSARTLGLSVGQYRAFDTDLGRDVGSGTLQNVVNAQHDITGQFWLQRATGLSAEQLSGMDAGSISAALAMAENKYVKSHPGWNMQTIQGAGFTQLGESQADLLLHSNTPLAEQARALGQYRRDSGSLNYGGGTVDALYEFTNRLHIAGQNIETYFSDKLSELNRNGALSNFITSLEKDAEILFNGILTEKNLSAVEDGFTKLATYLGSPDFQKAIATLSEDIISLAGWIAKALGIVSPDNGGSKSPGGAANPNGWGSNTYWDNPDNGNPTGWGSNNYLETGGMFGHKSIYEGPYYNLINPSTSTGKANLAKMAGLEGQYGLPSGLLASTAFLESSGNKMAVNPKSGAAGLFQFMEGTGRQYGVTNPFDSDQETKAAAHYYSDLLKMFNGDIRKSLAAYDWGQGNVQKTVDQYGASWEQHIPKESEDRIVKALMMMSKYKNNQATVKITNAAGANVAVSANAAAP